MNEQKTCPQCGAEIEMVGQAYCWNCGSSLEALPKSVNSVSQNAEEILDTATPEPRPALVENIISKVEAAPNASPKAGTNKVLLGVLAAIIVLLVVILIVVLSSKSNDERVVEEETVEVATEGTTDVASGATFASEDEYDHNEEDEFQSDDDDWQETLYDFACERELTASDLANMSKDELRIMRNWIFARHGYIFKSQDLKDYFGQFGWYNPRYSDVTSQLSRIEKQNIEFIKRYE
ncbi:MAG: YARHG domain-containing protein [Bacteroidaceae bacterium]|nr:YARHG domain-containing protein [Bacteroidaceae bacterium]